MRARLTLELNMSHQGKTMLSLEQASNSNALIWRKDKFSSHLSTGDFNDTGILFKNSWMSIQGGLVRVGDLSVGDQLIIDNKQRCTIVNYRRIPEPRFLLRVTHRCSGAKVPLNLGLDQYLQLQSVAFKSFFGKRNFWIKSSDLMGLKGFCLVQGSAGEMFRVETDRPCPVEVDGVRILLPIAGEAIQAPSLGETGLGSFIEDEMAIADVRLALLTLFKP